MTAVSHFQRFSQRENHATNNTLLVLRHLYQASPAKLEAVLHTLLGDTRIAIGVQFDQQVKGTHSVPDAHIYQSPWRVFVETKLGKDLDADQIARHIESISNKAQEGTTVLLGLTAGSVEQRKSDELSAMARAKSITFKWTTFFELQRAIAQHVAEYETSLIAVVRDYEDYLRSENLLQSRDDWLLVVPCGQSYEENRKFSLYYDGVDRPSRSGCRYLGIYKNRAISLLGDIVCVAVCSYKDGQVQLEREEYGKLTEERRARVKAAIEETAYYDLKSTTQRFFITDGLYETDIRKSTPSGIQGALYLSVDGLLRSRRDPSWDTAQLAEHLRGSSFPLPKDS